MSETKQYRLKICLIGDAGVGKTSLIRKYVEDLFDDKYIVTLGTKVTVKEVNFKTTDKNQGLKVVLMIWDILGQREFKRLQTSYYRGANGALVVADITRKETLVNTDDWILTMYNNVGKVPIILLLNKSDLSNQSSIAQEDIDRITKKHGISCLPTSAKTGENVEKAFQKLSRIMVEKNEKGIKFTSEPETKEESASIGTKANISSKN